MLGIRHLRPLAASLLILLAGAVPVAAQGTVTGTVIDATNGLTITGAAVRLDGTAREAITDRAGRFSFTNVPTGQQTFTTRYLGYAPVSVTVTVATSQRATAEFRITPATTTLGELVITETRTGQAAALNQQQNAPNVTNVIAADQIGRFPDANIGDALKRVPGVTVALDQGEARFGSIRGTEPRFNSVMVNGERVPSAEAEVREVQLDLIPADMVQSIEVNKTLTPEMDADAIGGSVNVVTRSAPVGFRLNTTVGSGYNFIRNKPVLVGGAVAGNRFFSDRLGVIVSASYYDQQFGSDNKEGVWNRTAGGDAFVRRFDLRRYDVQRTRRSVSGSFDYQLSENSSIMYRTIYNSRDDLENRWRARYTLGAPNAEGIQNTEIRRQTKGGIDNDRNRATRLEDQRTQSHQLSGQHLFANFATFDWSASIARASETRPNERYIDFRRTNVAIRPDYSDQQNPQFTPVDPSVLAPENFTFRRMEEENQFTKDEDKNGRLDLTLPFRNAQSTVKVGLRLRDKVKERNNSFDRITPVVGANFATMASNPNQDFSVSNNLVGNYRYGVFATPAFLGGLNLNDPTQFTRQSRPEEFAAGNFDATERITAGYAQLTQSLTPAMSLIAGVRVEQTRVDYNGFEFNLDNNSVTATTGDQAYTDFLPSVNFRWDVDARTVVRAAWTNTLARPNYFDLVPYREISIDDDELATGNPDLKTTRAMNLDLMVERFYENVGLVSAGLFYKDISDFIFNFTEFDALDPVTNRVFTQISRPRNGASASLVGLELAIQRQLDFLPGTFRHLGVYANYTFNESSVSGLDIPGRDVESLPLLGTARHSGNFSLSWDAPRANARIALNYQSESLDAGEGGYNTDAFFDRWADRRLDVDFNAGAVIRPGVRFFLEANNLNNRPLRFYQGTRGRLMQDEFYGRRIQTGFKIDF